MLVEKIEDLIKIVEKEQEKNNTVLVKKGVFDFIHYGHIYSINKFKEISDVVIILLQSDSLTTKRKGPMRPINSQNERTLVMNGLKGVDYVFMDNSNSREEYIEVLKRIKPDIVAITKDNEEKDKAYESKIWKTVAIKDKRIPGLSTTAIIQKVLDRKEKPV